MNNPDSTPSAPKRLQLKSRAEQKPAEESPPSEAEREDSAPVRRTHPLRLDSKPKPPPPEPVVEKTPPPPTFTPPESANFSNDSAETAEQIPETETPDPASILPERPGPSAKKTSPVYYVLLAVALIGSAYVLLKDKVIPTPPVIANEPAAATIRIAPAKETADPPLADLSVQPRQVQSPTSTNDALAAYLSDLRASRPMRSTSPEGIVIGGIFFPPGALLLKEHGLTFNGFKDNSSPDVALLSTDTEQFELQLY